MPNTDDSKRSKAMPAASDSATLGFPPPTPVEVSVMVEGGRYLFFTENGDSLYTYDRDRPGESRCYDACARQWTPLQALGGADRIVGDWSVLVRTDASHQWLFKGKPVYVNRDSSTPSQADGTEQLWRVLTP